jgi:plasmid stabilization system protein ParE
MAYRLARRAEADLDDIAHYIATESGSLDTASRVIEALVARFLFLADNPMRGGRGMTILGQGGEASPPTITSSSTASRAGTW